MKSRNKSRNIAINNKPDRVFSLPGFLLFSLCFERVSDDLTSSFD